MKENAQTSKRYQRGFEPGLSRLRVRHSTTEPPPLHGGGSRSLIPVPLLLCIAFHAVLFKRTSYLEGGRVICEAKMRKNNHIVIECGKYISSPRCE